MWDGILTTTNTNLRVIVATIREIVQQTASASNGCMGLPTLTMGRLMLLSIGLDSRHTLQYNQ